MTSFNFSDQFFRIEGCIMTEFLKNELALTKRVCYLIQNLKKH